MAFNCPPIRIHQHHRVVGRVGKRRHAGVFVRQGIHAVKL